MVLRLLILIIFDHQNKQQLPTADLWAFDYKRTALAQFRVGLEQNLLFFIEL